MSLFYIFIYSVWVITKYKRMGVWLCCRVYWFASASLRLLGPLSSSPAPPFSPLLLSAFGLRGTACCAVSVPCVSAVCLCMFRGPCVNTAAVHRSLAFPKAKEPPLAQARCVLFVLVLVVQQRLFFLVVRQQRRRRLCRKEQVVAQAAPPPLKESRPRVAPSCGPQRRRQHAHGRTHAAPFPFRGSRVHPARRAARHPDGTAARLYRDQAAKHGTPLRGFFMRR